MSNKPKRKKVNINKKDLTIQKPIEDFISEKDFTIGRISKEKVIIYEEPTLDEYIQEGGGTKGEFKQPDIIGKPFRTIMKGKTTSA